MRVLVDEGMPVQVLPPLRLNRGHEFDHVEELNWKGKKDIPLFRDAAAKGYEAVLTLDLAQLDSVARPSRRTGALPVLALTAPSSWTQFGDAGNGRRLTVLGCAIPVAATTVR